jgi:peptidoglycan hydrolase-like protein with peptidoglycan-binding domain
MKKIISFLIAVGFLVPSLIPLAHADTASIQAQLQAMMQELSQLQSQANGTTAAPSASASPSATSGYTFTTSMTVGSQGAEVSALQQILINNGYLTAIATPSGYFGQATKAALVQYQNANGISPATGYFGSLTMANVNAKNAAAINQPSSAGTSVNPPSPTVVQNPVQQAPVVQSQPTASLEANGSTGAIMIPYGSSVTLTWSSSNADSCTISPAELTGTSGDQTIPNLTAAQTYSLTCTKGSASAVASVMVSVAAPSQNYASPTPSQSYQQPTQTSPAVTSNGTVSQQNALRAAQNYLNYTAFSHDGLVAQLEYDQFSSADATYGADNSGADWNAEAAKAAKQYMSYTAFSRGSLIAQLEYDKFTQAQAEYGANAVGL